MSHFPEIEPVFWDTAFQVLAGTAHLVLAILNTIVFFLVSFACPARVRYTWNLIGNVDAGLKHQRVVC